MNSLMKRFLFIIAGLLLALIVFFHDEFGMALKIAGGVVALVFLVVLIFAGLYARERLLILRAERIKQQRDSHVLVVREQGQTHVRDTDHKAYWTALHLDPRIYSNGPGTKSPPSPDEVAAWQLFNTPSPGRAIPALLPEAVAAPVDLLSALDPVQRCLILGATDAGKTTLLQWLVSRRLSSSKVVMIDPHAYPGKWPGGCEVVGQGRKYADIGNALDALVQLMGDRYEEIGKGIVAEMGHTKMTIFIDEWRGIVRALGKPAKETIKTLLVESRKAAFSVFVVGHSDRAKPLGLDGEYDLKDGFAVVHLALVNGQRQATLDTGGEKVLAMLPGPFVPGGGRPVLEHEPLNLEVRPTPGETRILEMNAQGATISGMAAEVFGSKGGSQNKKVKDILDKFDKGR